MFLFKVILHYIFSVSNNSLKTLQKNFDTLPPPKKKMITLPSYQKYLVGTESLYVFCSYIQPHSYVPLHFYFILKIE